MIIFHSNLQIFRVPMNHKGNGIKERMQFVNLIIRKPVSVNPVYFCHINIPFQMYYNRVGLQDNHSIKGRNKKEPKPEGQQPETDVGRVQFPPGLIGEAKPKKIGIAKRGQRSRQLKSVWMVNKFCWFLR